MASSSMISIMMALISLDGADPEGQRQKARRGEQEIDDIDQGSDLRVTLLSPEMREPGVSPPFVMPAAAVKNS